MNRRRLRDGARSSALAQSSAHPVGVLGHSNSPLGRGWPQSASDIYRAVTLRVIRAELLPVVALCFLELPSGARRHLADGRETSPLTGSKFLCPRIADASTRSAHRRCAL